MGADINLDPASLALIVQKAVLDSITPEARDRLLSDAITKLLLIPEDDRPSYQRNTPLKSHLQSAFENAVSIAAQKAIREAIDSDPEVERAIREVVHPLVVDLCDGNYDGLPAAIGEAFASWLQDRRR